MNLLFTAPISQPLGRPTLSGCTITFFAINPDTLIATVRVILIEDPAPGLNYFATFTVTGATTVSQMLTSIKSSLATKYGVTFQ